MWKENRGSQERKMKITEKQNDECKQKMKKIKGRKNVKEKRMTIKQRKYDRKEKKEITAVQKYIKKK